MTARTSIACQECGETGTTPFAIVFKDLPYAPLCALCRVRVDPKATTPCGGFSEDFATMARVERGEDGDLRLLPLFTIGPLSFRRVFPRIARLFDG